MLSGRRLFYGETDFATVKQVQEAQIPSLRAENPAVPPELEQILARALAREPTARYPTARDLGKDLTAFLFRFGRPITAYDVAETVRAAVLLRKKSQPDKSSIIDKLIEEALLEFTSLQDDKAAPAAGGAPAKDEPLKLGFEDIGSWADELGTGAAPAARKAMPSSALEEGNLAALEETDPSMRTGLGPEARIAPAAAEKPVIKGLAGGAAPVTPVKAAEDASASLAVPEAPSGKGSSRVVAIVVALVAAAVGLWAAFGR